MPSRPARPPRIAVVAPITWRDGVHLTGTPIWCDARRRRDVCFVSAADRVVRASHGQLIATQTTLEILGAEPGQLAVPLGRPFNLGTLRLELIASGRGPGAASLFVDLGGRSVLYAGAIRFDVPPGTDAAAVRTCDAAVVAAPYGDVKFPPLADLLDRIAEACTRELAAGRRPVLFVDSIVDGVELAGCLGARGIALAAHRALRDAVPALPAPGKELRAVLWLAGDRNRWKQPHVAIDFVWPHAAPKAGVLEWLESTNAKTVYVTGASAPKIVAALGPRAKVIGPPHQMSLFPVGS